MKRRISIVLQLAQLFLVGSLFVVPAASAQDAASPATEESASRINVEELDNGATRVSIETTMPPIRVELPMQPKTVRCQANIALSYGQKNTVADVEGTIEYGECGASSGEYTVAVTTRDANGELQTQDFPETWQRSDSESVPVNAEYPIPENVDLVRVRTKQIRCVCADAPAE